MWVILMMHEGGRLDEVATVVVAHEPTDEDLIKLLIEDLTGHAREDYLDPSNTEVDPDLAAAIQKKHWAAAMGLIRSGGWLIDLHEIHTVHDLRGEEKR